MALLAKLNWRLYQEKDSLWTKVVLNKYYSRYNRSSKDPDKLSCSPIWTAVKAGFCVFEKGTCWNVGTNSNLKFWESKWVKGRMVRELIEGPLTRHETDLTNTNMFQFERWCWEKISFELPSEILEKILAIPMQLLGEREDTLAWKTSQDGDFSTASAYELAKPEDTNLQSFSGKWLWKLDTLPKIKHFLWLSFHHNVPVRQVLNARGILCNTCCPLCQNQEETIIYLLRDCPFALRFWNKIGTPQSISNFLHLDLLEWIKQNCHCDIRVQTNGIPWQSQFPFAIKGLWKHRNRVVFENLVSNPNLHLTLSG